MSEDDFRTQIALLNAALIDLKDRMKQTDADNRERINKLESSLKWVVMIAVGAVITQVLKTAGIGM